jgi:radical SAM superfamily enzyme with C-terminal helix-hairpin-helix motif
MNCPADSTGCLSWLCQDNVHRLDEAGSYGYIVNLKIDNQLLEKLPQVFDVKIEVSDGISIFGRNSGAYPVEISIKGR